MNAVPIRYVFFSPHTYKLRAPLLENSKSKSILKGIALVSGPCRIIVPLKMKLRKCLKLMLDNVF